MTKTQTRTTPRTKKKRRKADPGRWVATILLAVFTVLILLVFLGKKGHLGVDVSHHQGRIDWEQAVKHGGVEFAYIKATEGTDYLDKQYKPNRDGARRQGIPVGPYHFFRADKPGEAQFKHFSRTVGSDFDLIPVLDLEELGGKITDNARYQSEVQTFINLFLAHYGYRPIVYGSYSFMKDHVYPAGRDCDYWLAWYVPLASGIRDKRRFVNSLRPFIHARIWQYTDKGRIPGIEKNVDLDECWELQDIRVK